MNKELDIYGFKNLFVGLSQQGKIFGLNAFDGQFEWAADYSLTKDAKKIFLRDSYVRGEEFPQQQVVSVSGDSVVYLDAHTGGHLFTQKLDQNADQFMLFNLKQQKSQFMLAIDSK